MLQTITFTLLFSVFSQYLAQLEYKDIRAEDRIVMGDVVSRIQVNEPSLYYGLVAEPVKLRDGRAIILEQFLRGKGTYLADYADLIISVSDAYGVSYKLLVAIAGVESGYCRVNFKPYNCWGYGSVSWPDPEAAIRGFMQMMDKGYFSRGATTPATIASPYNPNPDQYLQKLLSHYNTIP